MLSVATSYKAGQVWQLLAHSSTTCCDQTYGPLLYLNNKVPIISTNFGGVEV